MKAIALLAAVCLTLGVGAGPASLDDSQIAAALAAGAKDKKKHHGLILRDSGQGFVAAMSAGGTGPTASSGFWLEGFTPLSWIEQESARAAREYRTLSLSDVGEEYREPVFRVIAHPDMPNTVTKGGMAGTSSVQHVVLRDESRKLVVQPIQKETFQEEAKNAMGAVMTFTGVTAKFSMDALRELRGANGDREFFITVVGESGEEKNFKVKKKHFDELK
jgi:hypothetical protein